MASLPAGGKKTAQVHPMRRSLPLTLEDSKILGKITERRKEKTAAAQKYNTRSFKHINSSWTPIVHKPSNEQIYKERRELVCNWFDVWTDSQRKRFLDLLFRHCHRRQLYFIQHWFDERVPLKHVDFTRILPRFLSMKIFSYVDPRSLSRAAMVSWNWKFITEQDGVWRPKCARLGWFLPYEPSLNEYGAWKRHYVACTQSLDVDIPSKTTSDLYGTLGDGTKVSKRKVYKKSTLKDDIAEQLLTARPAWRPPDAKPDDLEKAKKALLNDWNPNDPNVPAALLLYHNKFGQLKNGKQYKNDVEYGLSSSQRKSDNRALNSGEELGLDNYRESLTKKMDIERYEEKRMMQLTNQPWELPPPKQRAIPTGPNLTGGAGVYGGSMRHKNTQKMSKSYPHQENPRVVFISSRVPAADVLMDAVMFGVIPIVYEYEGTTLVSLLSQLDACLQGRNAQSIGIFTHTELSWEVRLVHGCSVTVDNLEEPAYVAFFETIASHVLPPEKGGHIDFFVPLGSSVPGTDLMTQLTTQTGMLFTSPTGIVGNYNHVSGEWSSDPEGCEPPTHYFCPSKMNVWSNTADTAKEACDVTKKVLGGYFEQKQRDVASQLVGQVVFDALGQIDVQGVSDLGTVLTDGLVELGKEQNVNACEYLGRYLLEKADEDGLLLGAQVPPNGTLAPTKTMKKPVSLSQQIRAVTCAKSDPDYLFVEDQAKLGDFQSELEEDREVEGITSNGGMLDDDFEKEIESNVDEGENYNSNNNIDLSLPDLHLHSDEDDLDMNSNDSVASSDDLNCNNNNNGSGDEAERPARGGNEYPGAHYSQGAPQRQPNSRRSQSSTHKSADFAMTLQNTSEWGDTMHTSGSQTARIPREKQGLGQSMQGTGPWTAETYRSHNDGLGTETLEHWAEGTPTRLTNQQFQMTADRRTMVAKEILSSEITYLRTLEIIKNTFFLPLKNALASNRAIISAHNVQIIFSDVMTLCSITKRLVDELRNRCSQWDSQSCLGDIFVKLSGKLKAYVNFLNNYPMILSTLDRSMEQVPLFRAFLKRHEKMPETRMLSLAELFLIPTRRIQEYCNLLGFFENNTPPDHADRSDLKRAITTMGDLQQLIIECKDRNQNERELLVLQKTIVKCPTLLESNRYLLRHLDVAHLKPPADTVSPEHRIYQHIEMLGLYLFNDALMVTKRSTKNFPFERSKEYIYVFEAVSGLLRLRVEDIADSKYVRNAFRMYTPRRSWVCSADSPDDKFNWITLVEKTVRAAINNK